MVDSKMSTFHPQGILLRNGEILLTTVDPNGGGYLNSYEFSETKFDESTTRFSLVPKEQVDLSQNVNGLNYNHAGGIDTDGKDIWVPLAVYRKKGPSKILRIEKEEKTIHIVEEQNVDDHLGTAIIDLKNQKARFFDWSTNCYSLPLNKVEDHYEIANKENVPMKKKSRSPWEYQDCKNLDGDGYALCGGKFGSITTRGELHLIHFNEDDSFEVVKAIRVPRVKAENGEVSDNSFDRPLSYNPMDVKFYCDEAKSLQFARFFFVPYDNADSRLFIFEVKN